MWGSIGPTGIASAALWLVTTGCGAVFEPNAAIPIENIETTGRGLPGTLADSPTGPHVELLTGTVEGRELEVVAQLDADGACIAIRRAPDGAEACGAVPGAEDRLGEAFGLILTGGSPAGDDIGSGPFEVGGMVSADVAAVIAELDDGRQARALLFPLEPAGIDGNGFILYLPAETPGHSLVARAADGGELGRLEFTPAP
jgi:hypothetical protein